MSLKFKLFAWLTDGKITLHNDKHTDPGHQHTGTLYNWNPSTMSIGQAPQQMNVTSSINFSVAKATGGWIVQVNENHVGLLNIANLSSNTSLYIITDDEDFDSALGKIVTMSCLKGA
jgi:hypothetical protein